MYKTYTTLEFIDEITSSPKGLKTTSQNSLNCEYRGESETVCKADAEPK